MKNFIKIICILLVMTMALSSCSLLSGGKTEAGSKGTESEAQSDSTKTQGGTNGISAKPDPNYVPKSNLDKELEEVEAAAEDYEKVLSSDTTQTNYNIAAEESYALWDNELNSLWARLKEKASESRMEEILTEQRAWLAKKTAAIDYAGSAVAGGTMEPMLRGMKGAELTRIRCYELATYLGELIDETVTMPKAELTGLYVDTQGTNTTAYSTLAIYYGYDNQYKPTTSFYDVTVSIYRVTTLEGKASINDNGIFEFEDDDLGVKAQIEIPDGKSAIFTVTESDWDLLADGEQLEFWDKW